MPYVNNPRLVMFTIIKPYHTIPCDTLPYNTLFLVGNVHLTYQSKPALPQAGGLHHPGGVAGDPGGLAARPRPRPHPPLGPLRPNHLATLNPDLFSYFVPCLKIQKYHQNYLDST